MESPRAETEEQQYKSVFTAVQVQMHMYISGKKMAELAMDQDTGYFPEQIPVHCSGFTRICLF